MKSRISKFKLLPRGFKNTLVLLPGWATDYRIFNTLDLNYNYLLPIKFCPFSFEQDLLEIVNTLPKERISLFGYSLGGFLASDFAAKYHYKIDELILLSIRRSYDHRVLKDIERRLKKNKRAYLYKFYLSCFSSNDQEGLSWFKNHLLKIYLDQMKLKDLMRGLEYLTFAGINSESLTKVKKIRIFHGQDDIIAPLKEAKQIKSFLPQADLICLSGTGHTLFLNSQFKDKFYG